MKPLTGLCMPMLAMLAMTAACSDSPATSPDITLPSKFQSDSTVLVLIPAGPSDKPLPSIMLTALTPATVQQLFGKVLADSAPLLQVDEATMQLLLAELTSGRVAIAQAPTGPRSFRLTLLYESARWECLLGPEAVTKLLADVHPASTAEQPGVLAWQQLRQWLDLPPV